MNRQQVTRNNQQSKNQTPLVSGILQRAAVHSPDAESSHYSESLFHQDFSRVPIINTAPIVQAKTAVSEEKKSNKTGLPDSLKAGIENLSGMAMDDVRVHYNSSKPSQLQALAYTQGTDIHVGTGQERHLPHEAWHVVQQKQGRVKPTMQMKKVHINDDVGLEREADMMGKKVEETGQKLISPELNYILQPSIQTKENAVISSSLTTIQKKISFVGQKNASRYHEIEELSSTIHQQVIDSINKNQELLKNTVSNNFEPIFRELKRPIAFSNIIDDLIKSPTNYGEINLQNPQHIVLFFSAAGKYLNSNYKTQKEKDLIDKHQEKDQEYLSKRANKNSPDLSQSYMTAFLGTGASVANYLNVYGRSLDPKQTIIIGKKQPWDISAENTESRGISFVNQPMHMTSPVRHETKLPQNSSGTDETFEGNPQNLTKDINTIMERFPNQVNATINKVSRDKDSDTKEYKIETNKGNFYALKVVSGLGIGPHRFANDPGLQKTITSEQDKEIEKKRVIDLDDFQRQLKNSQSNIMQDDERAKSQKKQLSIGVAGPNAGVDAVSEATKNNMKVEWVVSAGGPAIAEGMGNEIKNKTLVNLYFDYLKGWKISSQGLVEMHISGKWRGDNPKGQREQAGKKFQQEGWNISPKENAEVNYLVQAQGPDVQKVWDIFDKSATDDLTLKDDKQGHFGVHENADFWQGSVTTSLRSSPYNIYWEGIYNRVESVLGKDKVFAWEKTRNYLYENSLEILGVTEFERIKMQENVAIGLGSEDDSLEIIGGSAIRFLSYLDSQKDKDKVPKKLRDGKMEEKMNKVMTTLSSPTLLNNDQLTPIRSQIEAQGDYMPGYIGTEESNFVTDDQTMIAAQIASYYGNIPVNLANWVTQKIIQDRHQKGVRPGTKAGSRDFVDRWKKKLEDLHLLFSKEKIMAVADKKSDRIPD